METKAMAGKKPKTDVLHGTRIPQSKLTKSLHSLAPKMRKQTNIMRTLSGIRKAKGI